MKKICKKLFSKKMIVFLCIIDDEWIKENIKTAKEAEDLFRVALEGSFNENKLLIFKRWLELITNGKEINNVYNFIYSKRHYCGYHNKNYSVFREGEELSLYKWLEFISTSNGLNELYTKADDAGFCDVKGEIIMKWDKFSTLEIEKSSNVEEAERARRNASPANKDKAFKKSTGLISSFQEAQYLYNSVRHSTGFNEERDIIVDIWLSFTKTTQEAEEAYEDSEYKQEKLIMHKKWLELSFIEVNQASNLKEAEDAFYNAPSESEAERIALEKINLYRLESK